MYWQGQIFIMVWARMLKIGGLCIWIPRKGHCEFQALTCYIPVNMSLNSMGHCVFWSLGLGRWKLAPKNWPTKTIVDGFQILICGEDDGLKTEICDDWTNGWWFMADIRKAPPLARIFWLMMYFNQSCSFIIEISISVLSGGTQCLVVIKLYSKKFQITILYVVYAN